MHVLMIESNPAGIGGIKKAIEAGHQVTLITVDPKFYLSTNPEAKDIFADPCCQVVHDPEIFNIKNLLLAVDKINQKLKVDGVTTYSEYHVVHTAEVAQHLKLPGMNVEGAKNARFKHRTRAKLKNISTPQPKFIHVNVKDDIANAVAKIGYPCVIKPSDGTAGLHVVFIKNDEDLQNYLQEIEKLSDYGRGVICSKDLLIEEFIPGEIVSVESCVLNKDEIINLGVSDRILGGFPYFIEMGSAYFYHHPLREQLFDLTTQTLKALEIDFGFIHTEFILSENGPVLCEVNGRLVGGPIPKLMRISSGIDPFLEVIHLALGIPPKMSIPGDKIASCRLFGSPIKGKLNQFNFAGLDQLPGFVESAFYKNPGDKVSSLSRSNFDWLGHLIFEAETRDQAVQRSNAALDKISLDVTVDAAG